MGSPVKCDWYFLVGGVGLFFFGGGRGKGTHGVLVVRRVTPELSFSFSETKITEHYNRLLLIHS